MANALGIISFNHPDVYVEGLSDYRPIAAFNFIGRYRFVDFPLSNFSNSGIDQIQVYINGNPKPLIEHIGRGRQYNINSKRGNLSLVPIYPTKGYTHGMTDIQTFKGNLHSIMAHNSEYVVITPPNILYKANYMELLNQHIESGADISIMYQNVDNAKEAYFGCDVLQLNRQKGVLSIEKNLGKYKNRALSMQTYFMSKEVFNECIEEAEKVSSMYWLKDIISDFCQTKDVRGMTYRDYVYCVHDLESYYEANMVCLEEDRMKAWADPNWPIYTRSNDQAPAIYMDQGNSVGSFISNGAEIHGTVKNSIVGRSAKIGKGAVIENSIISSDATIGANAVLKNAIIDKQATVTKVKDLQGKPKAPIYVARREKV